MQILCNGLPHATSSQLAPYCPQQPHTPTNHTMLTYINTRYLYTVNTHVCHFCIKAFTKQHDWDAVHLNRHRRQARGMAAIQCTHLSTRIGLLMHHLTKGVCQVGQQTSTNAATRNYRFSRIHRCVLALSCGYISHTLPAPWIPLHELLSSLETVCCWHPTNSVMTKSNQQQPNKFHPQLQIRAVQMQAHIHARSPKECPLV